MGLGFVPPPPFGPPWSEPTRFRKPASMPSSVFVSFHYDRDYSRVQQVLNMGALESQPILKANEWETVERQGATAIKKWIADQMAGKSTLLVMVGAETSKRPWVDHEIRHAWDNHKKVLGIRIHGLKNLGQQTDWAGGDPFANIRLTNGTNLSTIVPLHNPAGADSKAVYASIANNLPGWIANAPKRGS